MFKEFFAENIAKIREINEKYKKPRLKMSPAARWALFFLRCYLLTLVVLLMFKFATTLIQ